MLIGFLVSILMLALVCLIFFLTNTPTQVERKEIVSFSIIIENGDNFDLLSTWLDDLNYSHFTFVLWEENEEDILNNSTRVNRLKQYGKIIPRRDYIQLETPSNRKAKIDDMIEKYNNSLGCIPKGIMAFIPDTYTCQYLLEKNFTYVQGYCFDQYSIDYMSMRGAWQLPYYADSFHVNIPNIHSSKGIIILPHVTWDFLESFRTSRELNLHPINLKRTFNNSVSREKQYFLELIDYTITGSNPFGIAFCQFEWNWILDKCYDDEVKDWLNTTIQTRPYEFWDFETIAQWFRANYQFTPCYNVDFVSPYSYERIEWYYDKKSRIARIGNEVVSYVDYTDQKADKYLTETGGIDWSKPWTDVNCIDTSLEFKIDAFGGGYLTHPCKTDPYNYTGDLSDFPSAYKSHSSQ